MLGKLDYESVISKPIKIKNRAITVLRDSWGIFNKNGSISRRTTLQVVRSLTEKWDGRISAEQKISLNDVVKEVCSPPYGGNIASAGLILGVYIAPRHDKLVVLRNGLQISISQWLQDEVFRGKFLNLLQKQQQEDLIVFDVNG